MFIVCSPTLIPLFERRDIEVGSSPAVPQTGVPFELGYWLSGNIPTEDRAELIGVAAVHETLSTNSKARAGRLKLVYGNDESQQGTGLGNLPGRLISLLSLPADAWQWDKMRAINRLPPLTAAEREELNEIKELSEGGLRLFELMSMECADAVDELAKLSRLLMDVEVYWLGTIDPPPRNIARKVCASLEMEKCTESEALKYFRRAFPDLASTDPGGDASMGWWTEKVRSMPKEAFATERRPPKPVTGGLRASKTPENADDEQPIAVDLARDFVVIVGGIEEARKHLS